MSRTLSTLVRQLDPTAFDPAGAAAAAQAASQPADSDLSAIAALATTAFGRQLLELANQAALAALAGGGGSLTSSSNYITADVTMTTAGTYYDGPSLTLAAGTWLLIGAVQILASSTANREFTVKLWDGTTTSTLVACKSSGTAQTFKANVPIFAIVAPGGSTTYKISATSTVNSDTLMGTTPSDKASYLLAIKIA